MKLNPEVKIRRLDSHEEASVYFTIGVLHASQMSTGFLSRLGPHFLVKLYRFLSADYYVYAAYVENQLVGFVSGAVDSRTIKWRFLQRMALGALPQLFFELIKPSSLIRAMSLWKYLLQEPSRVFPAAELLSVAVSPDFAHQGIGSKLVNALEAGFAEAGIRSYKVAASETQAAALNFYKRLGGRQAGLTDLGGLKTYLFVIERPSPATSV